MSKAEELAKLFELKKQGILTEEEFNQEKAKVLSTQVGNVASIAPPVQTTRIAHTPGQVDSASNFASCTMLQMSCPKCKGEVQFLPGVEVLRCTYCGNEIPVNSKESKNVRLPDQLLPFKVSRKEAQKRFLDTLANDDFVPDDIFDKKNILNVVGIYCPAYLFNGKYEGNWTAISIVKYTVKRGDKSHTEEQANPISGQVRGAIKFVVVASKIAAGTPIDANELRSRLKPYQPEFIQGFLIESLESAKSQEACEVLLRSHATQLAEQEAVKMMPTSDYRNLAVNVDVTSDATVFMQPLWCCEVNYKGSVTKMWLPSQTESESMAGEMPKDSERENMAEKLKKAGNMLYGVGFAGCCGIVIIAVSISSNMEGGRGSDAMTPDQHNAISIGFIVGLIFLGLFSFKGWRTSKAGEAELEAKLEKSKAHRRSNMPRA